MGLGVLGRPGAGRAGGRVGLAWLAPTPPQSTRTRARTLAAPSPPAARPSSPRRPALAAQSRRAALRSPAPLALGPSALGPGRGGWVAVPWDAKSQSGPRKAGEMRKGLGASASSRGLRATSSSLPSSGPGGIRTPRGCLFPAAGGSTRLSAAAGTQRQQRASSRVREGGRYTEEIFPRLAAKRCAAGAWRRC